MRRLLILWYTRISSQWPGISGLFFPNSNASVAAYVGECPGFGHFNGSRRSNSKDTKIVLFQLAAGPIPDFMFYRRTEEEQKNTASQDKSRGFPGVG